MRRDAISSKTEQGKPNALALRKARLPRPRVWADKEAADRAPGETGWYSRGSDS
jgi:hypothetical protein